MLNSVGGQKRWWEERVTGGWDAPNFWDQAKWNQPDYPVVGISWYEAVAFTRCLCEVTDEAIGLPTEEQWQHAAQGGTHSRVAWEGRPGTDNDEERCNWNMDSNGRHRDGTTPVTQFEGKGDSPFGVTDMNGNVREWCSTSWATGSNVLSGDEIRIARGGGWVMLYSYELNIGNLGRMNLRPIHRLDYMGFRIIRNPNE